MRHLFREMGFWTSFYAAVAIGIVIWDQFASDVLYLH